MRIREVIDELKNLPDREEVSLGEVMKRLEGRSLGVVLVLLALFNLIPLIGGVPGMPGLTALLIILVSLQSLFARKSSIWLPKRASSITFNREKFQNGVETVKPWFGWLDVIISARLQWLVNRHVIAICAIFLALTFFPLGVIPWGVVVPAMAIIFLGLSLIGRDGIAAGLGYLFTLGSLWFVWTFTPVALDTIRGWLSW